MRPLLGKLAAALASLGLSLAGASAQAQLSLAPPAPAASRAPSVAGWPSSEPPSLAASKLSEEPDVFAELPFGEECLTGPCASNPGVGAGQPRKFTGKERDKETGLDYFGARYYASKIGRFTTVDPLYTWQENLLDPQRWNRYSYVRNNPLRYVDPDGRGIVKHTVKLILKGGDIASTFAGVVDDAAVLFSANATVGTGARLLAAASLAFELLPVSGRDVKEGAELAAKGGTYLLRKADDTRDIMRTGRTKDLARRRGEHARNPATQDLEFEVDRCTDCYAAQRGREQIVHDLHKPPLDKVNPISPKNPRREEYLQAAEKIKDPQ